MKRSICLLLLSTAFLFFFSACQKDDGLTDLSANAEEGTYEDVPELLWPYFQRFEAAAEERGVAVDLRNQGISAQFRQIADDGVVGTCSYGNHQAGQIVIDLAFWNQAGEFFKEMIVFHELGHCSLFLDHREGVNSDGTCASIMRSGLGNCRDNYRSSTRETYLDELFE